MPYTTFYFDPKTQGMLTDQRHLLLWCVRPPLPHYFLGEFVWSFVLLAKIHRHSRPGLVQVLHPPHLLHNCPQENVYRNKLFFFFFSFPLILRINKPCSKVEHIHLYCISVVLLDVIILESSRLPVIWSCTLGCTVFLLFYSE